MTPSSGNIQPRVHAVRNRYTWRLRAWAPVYSRAIGARSKPDRRSLNVSRSANVRLLCGLNEGSAGVADFFQGPKARQGRLCGQRHASSRLSPAIGSARCPLPGLLGPWCRRCSSTCRAQHAQAFQIAGLARNSPELERDSIRDEAIGSRFSASRRSCDLCLRRVRHVGSNRVPMNTRFSHRL